MDAETRRICAKYTGKDTAVIADQRQNGLMGLRAMRQSMIATFWHDQDFERLAPGPDTWVTPETDAEVYPHGIDSMDVVVEVGSTGGYLMDVDEWLDDTTYWARHWAQVTKTAIYAAATMGQLYSVAELAEKRGCFDKLLRHFEIRERQIRRGRIKEAQVKDHNVALPMQAKDRINPRDLAHAAGAQALALHWRDNGRSGTDRYLVEGHVPKEAWFAMQELAGTARVETVGTGPGAQRCLVFGAFGEA